MSFAKRSRNAFLPARLNISIWHCCWELWALLLSAPIFSVGWLVRSYLEYDIFYIIIYSFALHWGISFFWVFLRVHSSRTVRLVRSFSRFSFLLTKYDLTRGAVVHLFFIEISVQGRLCCFWGRRPLLWKLACLLCGTMSFLQYSHFWLYENLWGIQESIGMWFFLFHNQFDGTGTPHSSLAEFFFINESMVRFLAGGNNAFVLIHRSHESWSRGSWGLKLHRSIYKGRKITIVLHHLTFLRLNFTRQQKPQPYEVSSWDRSKRTDYQNKDNKINARIMVPANPCSTRNLRILVLRHKTICVIMLQSQISIEKSETEFSFR